MKNCYTNAKECWYGSFFGFFMARNVAIGVQIRRHQKEY